MTTPEPVAIAGDELKAARQLRRAVLRTLGRSLHIRHLDAGSCNGCDWEIAALLNPYHDVQRLGIDFVASPRHADLLLVTGIMTRNLEDAARRTYEAMPEPRLVVAVGACAISGGVFAGSYAGRDGIGEVLPVDVFVPGCPPRPEALIHGLLVAVGRMAPFGDVRPLTRDLGRRDVAAGPPRVARGRRISGRCPTSTAGCQEANGDPRPAVPDRDRGDEPDRRDDRRRSDPRARPSRAERQHQDRGHADHGSDEHEQEPGPAAGRDPGAIPETSRSTRRDDDRATSRRRS